MSASATSSSNVQSTLEALEEQIDKMRDDHKVFMATLYGMLARLSDQPEGLLGARWAECLDWRPPHVGNARHCQR